MEKNFGAEKPLIAHVNIKQLLCDIIYAIVLLEPLLGFLVVFGEFLDNVRTHIAILFLDTFGRFQ